MEFTTLYYYTATKEVVAYFPGNVQSDKHNNIATLTRIVVPTSSFDEELFDAGFDDVVSEITVDAALEAEADIVEDTLANKGDFDTIHRSVDTGGADTVLYSDAQVEIMWDQSAQKPVMKTTGWGWKSGGSELCKGGTSTTQCSTGYITADDGVYFFLEFSNQDKIDMQLTYNGHGRYRVFSYFHRETKPEYEFELDRHQSNTLTLKLQITRAELI